MGGGQEALRYWRKYGVFLFCQFARGKSELHVRHAPCFFCQALQLRWMQTWDKQPEAGDATSMDAPIKLSHRFKRFIGMNHLKRAALHVIANQLTEADIGTSKIFVWSKVELERV